MLGSSVWPSNRADYHHWARIARGALSDDAWTAGWTVGGQLGAESVLDTGPGGEMAAEPAPARRPSAAFDLTRREREVAQLAAQGLSNRRIAEVLVIAEKTAANHLQGALQKLGVHSRTQLAARAVELGLLPQVERSLVAPVAG
jgi:non-specific serine/threonine protein kinase